MTLAARCDYTPRPVTSEQNQIRTIEYRFKFGNGTETRFTLRLRKPNLRLVSEPRTPLPDWTRLTHCQCPNCPLNPAQHPHCPIAVNLVDVIECFKDRLSFEEADITVLTEAREYHRHAAVQSGVSSLMGLHMVTSGCPIMDKLRPMAQTHLPFATVEESMYRAVSMYLLAQYFRNGRGKTADWKLDELLKIYEDIRQVNQSFVKRILSINPLDASINALISLDCFASITAFSIVRDSLKGMEPLFQAYLGEDE
jgi:hypothetical protein